MEPGSGAEIIDRRPVDRRWPAVRCDGHHRPVRVRQHVSLHHALPVGDHWNHVGTISADHERRVSKQAVTSVRVYVFTSKHILHNRGQSAKGCTVWQHNHLYA